jgi:hypothetical protein
MRNFLFFLCLLLSGKGMLAQTTFDTAIPLAPGNSKTGTVSANSRYVYYKTLLPANGTVTVYIKGEHKQGGTGSIDFYAYDKSHRQIGVKGTLGGKNIAAGEKFMDTVRLYSRAADSIYLVLYQNSSQTFDFTLQYEVPDQSANDPEPNDDFVQAKLLNHRQKAEGQIGYIANNVTDRHDYYKTLLPTSGTVTIYIEGIHTGGGSGSIDLYAYDKSRRQVQVKGTLGGKNISLGQRFKDTVRIYSREADSIYLLLYQNSSQSFSYTLQYEVTDQNINDTEPNNEFLQAAAIVHGETMYGRIGYVTNNVTDRHDYYKTLLPVTGTVKVYIEGTHTGGGSGSIDFYAYDKEKRQVHVKGTLGGRNIALGENFSDTIEIHSRAADSLYLVLYQNSSQSFDYSIRYEMVNISIDDAEPNNVIAEAVAIAPHDTMYGRIGYVANNVTDRYDYYRAVLPANGTFTIYIRGTHTGGGTGSVDLYAYDKSQRQIAVKGTLGGKNITMGQHFSDTVRVYSRTADTVYFAVYQNSSQSFDYAVSYEVLDQSTNDTEPNNDFLQALPLPYQEVVAGHIGYIANNITDRYDYYRAVLPADGTVTIYAEGVHTGGGNGSIDLYIYDRSRRQIGVKGTLGGKNIGLGERFSDTVQVFSRAADTVYFAVYQNSSQSFAYTLSYTVLNQSTNDPEPNNDFSEAKPIAHGEGIEGHIGYVADNVTDRYDYFKTLLPVDGTVTVYIEGMHTGGGNGSIDFYAYDKSRRQIHVKGTLGGKNIPPGEAFRDTIEIASRAADSIYLLLYQNSSQSFSYKLRYTMPDALQGDPEPNNTFDQAVTVPLTDTVRGLIGYVANAVNDASDYYKTAIPAYGNLKIFIDAQHTGANRAGFAIYAYDKNRRQVGVKSLTAVDPGDMLKDTLTVNCITSDSVYVLVYQPSSARSFNYSLQFAFEAQQPEAKIAYSRAGGTYEFTNQSGLATKYAWSMGNGEQYNTVAPPLITYNPGGYDVRLIVENELCRLKDTAMLMLVVNGLDRFTPISSGPGNVEFTAYGGGFHEGMTVTLKGSGGTYKDSLSAVNDHGSIFTAVIDLHDAAAGAYDVEIKTRDTVYRIPGGYICEAPVDKLKAEIVGRDIIRMNTNTPFAVRVFNEGNTMAGLIEVHVLFPSYMKVELLDSLTDLVNLRFPDIDLDTIPVFRKVTKAGNGYPIDGNLYSIFIAGVPAGGFRDISFTVNSAVGRERIYTWITGPNSGSAYKGWFDPCNKAKLKMVMDALLDGLAVIPVVDCGISAVRAAGSTLYSGIGYLLGYGAPPAASVGKTWAGVAKNCAGEALAAAGFAPGIAVEIADVLADIGIMGSNAHLNAAMVRDACNDEPKEEKEKEVDVRTSLDPNAKSGPSGYGAAGYINGRDKILNYTIFFENVDTATLPAQVVTIVDTLDKNVFDLESFRALSFSIGTKKFIVPMGASDYVMDVSLNAVHDVRISIGLSKETGIMKTVFKTLDKRTGTITEDPLAGFLPPNKNSPEGEGSISFAINMKEGLPDGTVIANRASIIFDSNEPIVTDEWINTIDKNLPASRVMEIKQLSDSTGVIKINGTDAASGIGHYRLYMSENGEAFQYLGTMKGDTALFTGRPGRNYDFYAVSVDKVGNREVKNAVAEAGIKFITDEPQVSESQLYLYPVPSNGAIHIELNVPEAQQLNIAVYNASGGRVAELYNGNAGSGNLKITKNLYNLSSGLYFVHARGSKGISQKKKMVLVK